MNWGAEDFLAAAIMLCGLGGLFWLAMRQSADPRYLVGAAIALGSILLLVWVSLAVGIIGDEGNPANLVFAAVIAVAVIGAIASRLGPAGLSRAMLATAAAQGAAGAVAVFLTARQPDAPGVWTIVCFNLLLAAAFVVSAWLFRAASQVHRPRN